jgi:hypothetical protein
MLHDAVLGLDRFNRFFAKLNYAIWTAHLTTVD